MKVETIEYFCDHCSESVENRRHLSISFGNGWSGYVEEKEEGWRYIQNAIRPRNEGIKQFCSTRCLYRYFLREI